MCGRGRDAPLVQLIVSVRCSKQDWRTTMARQGEWYSPSRPYGSTEEHRIVLMLTDLRIISIRGGDRNGQWILMCKVDCAVYFDWCLSPDEVKTSAINLYREQLTAALKQLGG